MFTKPFSIAIRGQILTLVILGLYFELLLKLQWYKCSDQIFVIYRETHLLVVSVPLWLCCRVQRLFDIGCSIMCIWLAWILSPQAQPCWPGHQGEVVHSQVLSTASCYSQTSDIVCKAAIIFRGNFYCSAYFGFESSRTMAVRWVVVVFVNIVVQTRTASKSFPRSAITW